MMHGPINIRLVALKVNLTQVLCLNPPLCRLYYHMHILYLWLIFLCPSVMFWTATFLNLGQRSSADSISASSQFCLLNSQIVEEWKTNLMSLAVLFHLLCAQHVSDINISIFRSLQLCWWITTSVVLFSVRCVLEFFAAADIWWCSFCRLKHETTDVVIHQHSRRLLKMDILMSEICWAHNKWNKI